MPTEKLYSLTYGEHNCSGLNLIKHNFISTNKEKKLLLNSFIHLSTTDPVRITITVDVVTVIYV
jgi:hypothetical protein